MNIQSLLPKPQPFEIVKPGGFKTGIILTIIGQDSHEVRAAAKKLAVQQLTRKAKGEIADPTGEDLDLLEEQRLEMALVCITDWSGLEDDDVPVPFSKDKARELLNNPGLGFLVEDIEKFVTTRANFFRPSSTNTVPMGRAAGKSSKK